MTGAMPHIGTGMSVSPSSRRPSSNALCCAICDALTSSRRSGGGSLMDVLIDHFIRAIGEIAHYGRYWSQNAGRLETEASRFSRESAPIHRPQDKIRLSSEWDRAAKGLPKWRKPI